jgi:hypothetical protein
MILEAKMVKRGSQAATKVLVQWKDTPPDMATGEFYYDLLKKFPNFYYFSQGCSLGEGIVTAYPRLSKNKILLLFYYFSSSNYLL